MSTTTSNLGTERVGKLLFQLALPAITAQLINLLYNMVDRMYIGHIKDVGAVALTGVGVTLPILMVISAFAALIGSGGAPRASIFMGRGENESAEKILGNCVTMLVVISLVLTILFRGFSEPILLMFGADLETLPYAKSYMDIYVCGTIFVQIALGLNMFITSQGFAGISMRNVIIGAVCNIILDPVFIFGFQMGVKGAALATILSQALSAFLVLKFLFGNRTILKIRKGNLRLEKEYVGSVIALGVAPFIMQSTESIIAVCYNTSLLKYGGNLAVGAMTILVSVMQFAMMPLQGLTQGMQPIVSFNYGAKNVQRVKKAFQITLIVSLIYTTIMWAAAMIAPEFFASLFTKDESLISYTVWALRVYMAVSCIFGAQIACQQTFISIGNAKTSLFLAILRKIILLIPMIYLLPAVLPVEKTFAVFLSEPVSDAIAVCVTVSMFTVQFRKAMKDLENGKQ